jgi:hypothetical protein
MTLTLNLGFDRGNSRTNVAAIDGNKFVELDMSSMIAEGNAKKYATVKAGSGATEGANATELMLEYEGNTYFLGDLAMHGKNPTTGFGDKGRYHSRDTKVALMASAAMLASRMSGPIHHDIAVNLVMGVPFQAFQAERSEIARELTSTYRFDFGGRKYAMHVDTVRVFMEGAGAAIYAGLEKTGAVGVVDSGSLTTNVLRFNGAEADTERCTSFEIGVATALDRLNARFENRYDRELTEPEKQDVLHAFVGLGSYPELYADGKQVSGADLHEWMHLSIEETGRDRNSRISRLWSNDKGKVGADFKRVIHVGGGAYYFHPSLQQLIKSAERLEDAEKANSRGFAVLAGQIAARKASLAKRA